MAKRKSIIASTDNTEQLALNGIAYVQTKESIKELDGKCKELRVPLEDAVKANGKVTDNGSKILVIPYADKEVHIKETLRVGKVLLPEAIDVLKENGLGKCIENVPTIREDVLEKLYEDGKVSDEVLQKVYAEKPTWAFSVSLKPRYEE